MCNAPSVRDDDLSQREFPAHLTLQEVVMYRLLAVVAILLTGCGGDQIVQADDVLAQDSVLAREVMSASGDLIVDQPVFIPNEEPATRTAPAKTAPAKPTPLPKPVQSRAIAITASPASPAPRVTVQRPREERSRTGVISEGTALTVVANNRACGNTFSARVVNSIRGSNGVTIPSGSIATGEILSADKWGAGLSVRVRSVRVNGKSYPVNSRATYIMPARGEEPCVPGGARIEVETRAPLRLAMSGM